MPAAARTDGGAGPAKTTGDMNNNYSSFRKSDKNDLKTDWGIGSESILLIGPEGENLGAVKLAEAVREAREEGLSVVQVSAGSPASGGGASTLPVCKIVDAGRFKYEKSKKDKDARKKQKAQGLKEIRMRPKIARHDLEVKSRAASGFLRSGHKVRISVFFRGREAAFKENGYKLLEEMARLIADDGRFEGQPKSEGPYLHVTAAPAARQAAGGKQE